MDLGSWEGLSLSLIIARERTSETPSLLRRAVALLEAEKVKVKPILSHILPFEKAMEAFKLLENHPEKALK